MLNILVPTDFSPEAKNACLYAYHFARYTNSQIVLYHAIPTALPVTDIPYENYYLDEMEERELLHDGFKQLIKQHGLDPLAIPVTTEVNYHNQVSAGIQDAYKKLDCDMVIMGTHGASGLGQVIMGSNTARLIAHSRFPILAIPSGYQFEPIYHLIYSSDLTRLEEELGVLVPFAAVFQAVLEIFYFDYAGPESEKLILDAEKFIRDHHYKNISLNVKKGNIQLSIAENLRRQIDSGNTQMLVIYRSEHSWLDNLLQGSNSQKLVSDPTIPVLILPKS